MAITTATALAIGTLGYSMYAGKQQQKAMNRANSLQKESNKVSTAQETIRSRAARRRQAREERLRRARLLSSAAQGGGMGGSGMLGATSALGANFGAARANQSSQLRGTQAISSLNQGAANAQSSYDRWGARSNLVTSAYSFGSKLDWF